MSKKFLSYNLIFIFIFTSLFYKNSFAKDSIIAKSYILYNPSTFEVLSGSNIEERLPMASTTKIMTSLILFSQNNLDEEFVVDKDAIKVEGSSMGLVEGDIVTLRALGYGMLLKSGNDAAGAAAVRIGGSIPKFVEMMNNKAKELGLLNTNFVTPSGLDDENHYSTSKDMAVLAAHALKNQEFLKVCSSKSATVSYGNPPYKRTLTNSNKLLSSYEGTIGVKTGFTKKSGRCLVSAVRRDNQTLICVTLGAADDWNVHKNLFDYGFSLIKQKQIKKEDYNFEIDVENAKDDINKVKVGITQDVQFSYIIKNQDLSEVIQFNEKKISAPVTKGQVVGNIKFVYNDHEIYKVPIVALDDVLVKEEKVKKNVFKKILEFFGIK